MTSLGLLACAALVAAVMPQRYRSVPNIPPPAARHLSARLEAYRKDETALLMVDFGQQYIYAEANRNLPVPAAGERRVVFLGDSITDFWNLSAHFPGKAYVNRGISGQVTPQMVVRFRADVVALKPAAVVILAGVNDASGVLQTQTEQQIEANYESLADLATVNRIRPIFTKLLPINRYNQASRSFDADRDAAPLLRLNHWLVRFCSRRGYKLIDYEQALRGTDGQLRADYSVDGLHPNDTGYSVMAPIAERAIEAALKDR